MNHLTMTINDEQIQVKEYQGTRVVTLADIDRVHKRPPGTARKRFNFHKDRFIKGVDYFVLNTDIAQKEFNTIAPNGLTVVTESGYLMLVKSFNDVLAWEVQRSLVSNYFRKKRKRRFADRRKPSGHGRTGSPEATGSQRPDHTAPGSADKRDGPKGRLYRHHPGQQRPGQYDTDRKRLRHGR